MLQEKNNLFILISQHEDIEVMQNKDNEQKSLFAACDFNLGDTIATFDASKIVDTPNYLTIQIAQLILRLWIRNFHFRAMLAIPIHDRLPEESLRISSV